MNATVGLATIALVATATGAPGGALAAPLPVETASIEQSTEQYDLAVYYPRTGLAAVDDVIGGWARGLADGFVNQANEDFANFASGDRPPWSYSLDLNFRVARNDDVLFAVNFDESVFTGGAHPNHDVKTFNMLMPDGWQVFLPEIFDPLGVERISELAIADLLRQWDGGDSMSDDDWLTTGAGPEWSNFENFLLLEDRLIIRFPPYQVAAYAAGEQIVELPLAELDGLMRADWRTPVPSFDCALAGTDTEDAICSDIALARLDRQLADAYRLKLRYADDEERTTIRDAQRTWIGTRNACGGDITCLSGAYESRLAALGPG